MPEEPLNREMPPELPDEDEQLVAYLDGELDPEESRRVDERLSDPLMRKKLQGLQRSWDLLDELTPCPVDEAFTRSTMEMVTVAAVEEVAATQASLPRVRRRRWAFGLAAVLVAGAAGFVVGWFSWPDPNRELLENLPLVERLDEYRQVREFRFLKKLAAEGLFEEDREWRP